MGSARAGVHRSKRGLDIPLAGAPAQVIEPGPRILRVALVAEDFHGLRARLLVAEGDVVARGQPLLADRGSPGVFHTSPAAGRVVRIERGARRVLENIVIEVDEAEDPAEVRYEAFDGTPPDALRPEAARRLLLESGLWTALRARPFNRVPAAQDVARSCFVTAIDTRPHAPDVDLIVLAREEAFRDGLRVLVALMDGRPVHLCVRAGSALEAIDTRGVTVQRFEGPHPAGNPGYHMHVLDPVDANRRAWHVGYQDVIAMGALARTGRLMVERVAALSGPAALSPRLIETRLGASIAQLTAGEVRDGEVRVISGSVLDGRAASDSTRAFLGRYHTQVCALFDRPKRRFLGWLTPGFSAYSTTRLFASGLLGKRSYALDTAMNGQPRAMILAGPLERVLPFDLMPGFLFRAVLSGNLERAQELGCLELEPEDVALCTFVCASKTDYGAALRGVLDRLEAQE